MSTTQTPAPVIRPKTNILDKSLSRGKQEVSLSAFALLFSEMVQYCQSRSSTVPELQQKLHELGWQVGARLLDLVVVRDRAGRRETKVRIQKRAVAFGRLQFSVTEIERKKLPRLRPIFNLAPRGEVIPWG
jgi:hypothetical protein